MGKVNLFVIVVCTRTNIHIRKELTVSLVHGYLNSTPDDFGHRWTNSYDGDNVECQYCGDSYNSKRWCTNRLVVSEQDREMDESMSRYYSQEAE